MMDNYKTNQNSQFTRINTVPIFLKEKTPLLELDPSEIYWIESYGSYLSIKTANDRFTVNATMKEMLQMLPAKNFVRVHRSYIVAIDKIIAINGKTIAIDQKLIPISSAYNDVLKKWTKPT